ncbi:hypothetical protein EDD16DRAFT_1533731 [Pisolithus croceorrhizus]|nr:hypothetical protein EDD16DRAFT_1533731 [Pisolithus croceorrhizus]
MAVGDVLYSIHHSLRRQIFYADWVTSSHWKHTVVSRAYTRSYSSVPQITRLAANRGVRRVDCSRDGHIFRGLVKKRATQMDFYR